MSLADWGYLPQDFGYEPDDDDELDNRCSRCGAFVKLTPDKPSLTVHGPDIVETEGVWCTKCGHEIWASERVVASVWPRFDYSGMFTTGDADAEDQEPVFGPAEYVVAGDASDDDLPF
jgi:DNA-directed RNA polymerase subunit RPC12/RpoP